MRRVHCVAHQHDVAVAVEMVPAAAAHTLEVDPRRTAFQRVHMAGVAQQFVPLQVFGEQQNLVGVTRVMRDLSGDRLVDRVRLATDHHGALEIGGGPRHRSVVRVACR